MSKADDFPKVPAEFLMPLVERFLKENETGEGAISATRLGIEAKKDSALIFNLRLGREPRRATIDAIIATIEGLRPGYVRKFFEQHGGSYA